MYYLHFACRVGGGTPSMRKGSFKTKVRILLRGLSRHFSKEREENLLYGKQMRDNTLRGGRQPYVGGCQK